MWFEVKTYRPGPMAYSVKLFLEEQGVLKTLELPFDAHCVADPNKPAEENNDDSGDDNTQDGDAKNIDEGSDREDNEDGKDNDGGQK
jgi:hypothetical protein